jgi:hypothetical protein
MCSRSSFCSITAVIFSLVRGAACMAKPFHHWNSRLPCLRHSRFQHLGVPSVSSVQPLFQRSAASAFSYRIFCSES